MPKNPKIVVLICHLFLLFTLVNLELNKRKDTNQAED